MVCNFKIKYILKEAFVAIPFSIKPSNISVTLNRGFQFQKGILFQRFVIARGSFKASSMSWPTCIRMITFCTNENPYFQVQLIIVMPKAVLINVPMTMILRTTSVLVLLVYSCPTMIKLAEVHPRIFPQLPNVQLLLSCYQLIVFGQNGVIGHLVQQLVENLHSEQGTGKWSSQPGMEEAAKARIWSHGIAHQELVSPQPLPHLLKKQL